MRFLVVDKSKESQQAIRILKDKQINFEVIPIEQSFTNNFKVPLLLTPEGRFEGIDLVRTYTKAEENGFHKKLEISV